MNRLDVKGEEALDVFAELLDPLFAILNDDEVKKAYRSSSILKAVQCAIKNHKKEVICCLAIIEGEDPETYKPGVFTLPVKVLQLLNAPEFADLFTLQGQKKPSASSGSAMADTMGSVG